MHWLLLSLVVAGAIATPVDEEKAAAKADAAERDEKCEFLEEKEWKKMY